MQGPVGDDDEFCGCAALEPRPDEFVEQRLSHSRRLLVLVAGGDPGAEGLDPFRHLLAADRETSHRHRLPVHRPEDRPALVGHEVLQEQGAFRQERLHLGQREGLHGHEGGLFAVQLADPLEEGLIGVAGQLQLTAERGGVLGERFQRVDPLPQRLLLGDEGFTASPAEGHPVAQQIQKRPRPRPLADVEGLGAFPLVEQGQARSS